MKSDLRDRPEFKRGHAGELRIAGRLQELGWHIIPSYDYSGADDDKAPKLHGLRSNYVLPDLDVCRDGRRRWVEVKTKADAVLHRNSGQWEHGIPLRHWKHYHEVQRITGSPVWLCIFEESSCAVLLQAIDVLAGYVREYHGNAMSPGGMAFFPRWSFRHWTTLDRAA